MSQQRYGPRNFEECAKCVCLARGSSDWPTSEAIPNASGLALTLWRGLAASGRNQPRVVTRKSSSIAAIQLPEGIQTAVPGPTLTNLTLAKPGT